MKLKAIFGTFVVFCLTVFVLASEDVKLPSKENIVKVVKDKKSLKFHVQYKRLLTINF
ncbi:hypothetical protein AGMMS49990_10560 [Endomicrobiia bacterium]|nr:hypothetical protein AGMMS49990_10560 [Endomicrobiia bacterium]